MNLLLVLLTMMLRTSGFAPDVPDEGIQSVDETYPVGIEDASLDSDGAGRFRDRFVRR